MATLAEFAILLPLFAGLGWASVAAVNLARADDAVFDASREMGAWAAARMSPERCAVTPLSEAATPHNTALRSRAARSFERVSEDRLHAACWWR